MILGTVQGLLEYGFVVGNLVSGVRHGARTVWALALDHKLLVLGGLIGALVVWASIGFGARRS